MVAATSTYRLFVAVSPGLEGLLEQELVGLGLSPKPLAGGVEVSGELSALWAIHLKSRLAENVRLRLKPFRAKSFPELVGELSKLPWHAYLRPGRALDVSVTCHKSRLYHSGAVAERVREVIEARLGAPALPPATDGSGQRVFVRLDHDGVQVSVDASGERLHKRGYRSHVGAAPLRETLAAALALQLETASGEGAATPVWDPFCGSGTLLTEWLLLCAKRPPGAHRRFGFEDWPIHDPRAYAAFVEQQPLGVELSEVRAIGSDHSAAAIAAARENSQRAGLRAACRFITADFREAVRQIPEGTRVLTNPPYGVRLAPGGAGRLLRQLERVLIERRDLRPVVLATTDRSYPTRSRLGWRPALSFKSGGLSVQALVVS